MSLIRSYKRNISRNRMKFNGFRKINKGQKAGSYFSNHWKDELNYIPRNNKNHICHRNDEKHNVPQAV